MDIELTSRRDDGTWTWRAAGARQPKGDLDGTLLFDGVKVGDVVKVEAEKLLDGIVVTQVFAPKGARKEAERIEILGRPVRDDELVTSKLAPKGKGDRRERRPRRDDGEGGERRERRDRRDGADRGARPDGARSQRPDGARSQRPGDARSQRPGDARSQRPGADRRERRPRPERPAPEPRPKAKRLRPSRTHRSAVLAALPEEQKPIAEQVLRGGIPAVRQAIEKQNEQNRAEGRPEVPDAQLLKMAEELMPALKTAEWRDRADAALRDLAELDLRDLRSVVVAADGAARDEETRALADQLRAGLEQRVAAEQALWLAEITETLDSGRVVRALRVSSRPPKAGEQLPAALADRLVEATNASLTAETGSDRYATVLDALSYSPVRTRVVPQGRPTEPTPELVATVTRLASRLPEIATSFGIDPSAPKPRRPKPPRPAAPAAPAAVATPVETPAEDAVADAEADEVTSPAPESAVTEVATDDAVEAVESDAPEASSEGTEAPTAD